MGFTSWSCPIFVRNLQNGTHDRPEFICGHFMVASGRQYRNVKATNTIAYAPSTQEQRISFVDVSCVMLADIKNHAGN